MGAPGFLSEYEGIGCWHCGAGPWPTASVKADPGSNGTYEIPCLKGQAPSNETFNKENDHASLQNRRSGLHH